jgi:hypothetical protein
MYYAREAERDFLFTRAVLLFLFTLILALILSLSVSRGARHGLIKAGPIETVGQITQLESVGPRNSSTNVYYTFSHEGQREDGMVNNSFHVEDPGYEIGADVAVVYSRWFPSVHNIKANFHYSSPNFFILSVSASLMILCWVLILWTVHRIYQHKADDRYY